MKKALRMGSRRILAFILSLSMVLSYVPSASTITAFADEMTEDVYEDAVIEENEEVEKAVVEEVAEDEAKVETPVTVAEDDDDEAAEEDTDSGLEGARGIIVEEAAGFYSYYDDADRGVRVIVKAEEGIVPEGAHLDVEPVELDGEDMISESGDEDVLVSQKFSYDIKIYLDEEEEEEFQPENAGDVTVKFVMLDAIDDELFDAKIYHKADDAEEADELETKVEIVDAVEVINEAAQTADAEKINDEEIDLEKGTEVTTAEVEAPGFSLYVFELYQVAYINKAIDYTAAQDSRMFQVTAEGIRVNSTDILEAIGLVATGSSITEIHYSKGYTVSLDGNNITDGISISANDPSTAEDDTYVVFGNKAVEDLLANDGEVCLIYNLYDQNDVFHKLYVAITLVEVASGSAYPIWVDGILVTENNKDDVLGDGTGSVQFTPADGITAAKLVVNNANITKYADFTREDAVDPNKYVDIYNKYRAARGISDTDETESENELFGYGGIYSLLDDKLEIEFTGKNVICYENDADINNTASWSNAATPTVYGIFAKESVVVNVGTDEKAGDLRIGSDLKVEAELDDTVAPEFGIVSRNGKIQIKSTANSHMSLAANYVGIKAYGNVTFSTDGITEIKVLRPDYVGNADSYTVNPTSIATHPDVTFRYYASGVVSRTGNVTFANTKDLVVYSEDQNNVVSAEENVIFKNTADVTIMSKPLTETVRTANRAKLNTVGSGTGSLIKYGTMEIPESEYNDYGNFVPYNADEDANDSNGIKAKEIEVYIDTLGDDSSINIVGAESAAEIDNITYIGELDDNNETLKTLPYVKHSFIGFDYNFVPETYYLTYTNSSDNFDHEWLTEDPLYGFSHRTTHTDSDYNPGRPSNRTKHSDSDYYEYVFPTFMEIENAENYAETAGVMIQKSNNTDRKYYSLTINEESFVNCDCDGKVIDEYDAAFMATYSDARYAQTVDNDIWNLEGHVVQVASGSYIYGENALAASDTDPLQQHNIFDLLQFSSAIATACEYGEDIYKIDSTYVENVDGWDKGDLSLDVEDHDKPEVVNPADFKNDGSENAYTVYIPNMQRDLTINMRTFYNVWVGEPDTATPAQVSTDNWGHGTDSDWTYCPIDNILYLNDYHYNGGVDPRYYDTNGKPATESNAAILYEGTRDFTINVVEDSSVAGKDWLSAAAGDHNTHVISAPTANIVIEGEKTLEVLERAPYEDTKSVSGSAIYAKDITVNETALTVETIGNVTTADYYLAAIYAQGDFTVASGSNVTAIGGAIETTGKAASTAVRTNGDVSVDETSALAVISGKVKATAIDERDLSIATSSLALMDDLPLTAGLVAGGNIDIAGKFTANAGGNLGSAKVVAVGAYAQGAANISGDAYIGMTAEAQSIIGLIADAEDSDSAPAVAVSGKLEIESDADSVVLNTGIMALNGTLDAADGSEINVTTGKANASLPVFTGKLNAKNATIKATAGDGTVLSAPIFVLSDIEINDGKVTAQAGDAEYSVAVNAGIASLEDNSTNTVAVNYIKRFIPADKYTTGKITVKGDADVYAYAAGATNVSAAIVTGPLAFDDDATATDCAAYKIKIDEDAYVVALSDAGTSTTAQQAGVLSYGDIVVKGDKDTSLSGNKPQTSALVVALTGTCKNSVGVDAWGYILNDGGYISVSGVKDQPGSFDGVSVASNVQVNEDALGISTDQDIVNVNNAYTGVRLGSIKDGSNNNKFTSSCGIRTKGTFYNGFIAGNPSIRAQEELLENAEGGEVYVYGVQNQQHKTSNYICYGMYIKGDFKQYGENAKTNVVTYNTNLDADETNSEGIYLAGLMYINNGEVNVQVGQSYSSQGIIARGGLDAHNDAYIEAKVDGTTSVNNKAVTSAGIMTGYYGYGASIYTTDDAVVIGRASAAAQTSRGICSNAINSTGNSRVEGYAEQSGNYSFGIEAMSIDVDHATVKGYAKSIVEISGLGNGTDEGLSIGIMTTNALNAKNGAYVEGKLLNKNGGSDKYLDEKFYKAYGIMAGTGMTVEGASTNVVASAKAAKVTSGTKSMIAGICAGIFDNYSDDLTYSTVTINDGTVKAYGGYYANAYITDADSVYTSHGIIAGDIFVNNGLLYADAGDEQSQNNIYGISAVGKTGGTYPQLYISDLAEVVAVSATQTPFYNNNHLGGNIYKTGYAPVITLANDLTGLSFIGNSVVDPTNSTIAEPETVGTSEIYTTGLNNKYVAIRRGAYIAFDKAMDEVATDSEEKVYRDGTATDLDDIKAVAYTEKDADGNYVLRIKSLGANADDTIKNEHFTLLGWNDGTEVLTEGVDSLIPEERAKIAADETARKLALTSTFGELEYTITYDVLDGEFRENVATTTTYCYNNGVDTKLSSNLVTLYDDEDDVIKTGYHLLGWDIEHENIATPANAFFADFSNPVHEDLTAKAVWEANNYTVIYKTEEGAVLGSDSVYYDQEFDLPVLQERFADIPAAQLEKYMSYTGWVLEGEDVPYVQGQTVSNLTTVEDGTVTLIATTEFNVFVVKFDSNGGDEFDENDVRREIPDQVYRYGKDKALNSEMRFAKKGYTFVGWATQSDGEPVFEKFVKNGSGRYVVSKTGAYRYDWNVVGEEGVRASQLSFGTPSSVSNTDYPVVTLYAIWTPNQYSIDFYDYEDPTRKVINNTYEVYYDDQIDLPEQGDLDYVKPGYHLDCWRDSRSTQSTYVDGKINLTDELYGKVTLLADWAPNSFTIKYIGGYQIDGYTPIRTTGANPRFYFTVPVVYDSINYAELPFSDGSNVFEYPGYHQTGWEQTGADKASFIPTYGENVVQELTAVWAPNEYTVKFDGNGGSGNMPSMTFTYDQAQNLTANAFIKTGYTFGGWSFGNETFEDTESVENLTLTENGEVTLTAIWVAEKITIEYQPGEGNGTAQYEEVPYDQATTLETIENLKFYKKGYRFDHWVSDRSEDDNFADGEEVINLLNEKGTVVLTAVWTPLKYTIKYSDADSIYTQDQEVTYDDDSSLLPIADAKFDIFRKTGYTFKSWKIAGDFTGNVDWHFTDGVTLTNDTHSKLFDGISYNETTGKWEVVLQAEWTENSYSVVFNSNKPADTASVIENYMEPQSFKYSEGQKLDANQFALKGYKFVKWVDEATGKDYNDNQYVNKLATENNAVVNLKAIWTPITYTVVLDNNLEGTDHETKTLSQKASYDETYYLPNAPFSRYGYKMTGYLFNNYAAKPVALESFSENYTSTDNDVVTLYAVWVADEYTITFDNNGKSTAPAAITKKFETNIVAEMAAATDTIKNGTHTGYEFGGWYYTNNYGYDIPFNPVTMPGVNVTVFAKWIPITYTVQFNGNSADNMTAMDGLSFTATYDAEKNLPENLYTKVGYTFNGWGTNAAGTTPAPLYADKATIEATDNLTAVKGDTVTLYAQWKAEPYTITFTTEKGSTPAVLTERWGYDISAGMNDATQALGAVTGYEFAGWYFTNMDGDDVKFTQTVMPKKDYTLKAKWTPITYTVKFDGNGATNMTAMDGESFTATYDAEKNLPENLFERKGYVFKGWTTKAAPETSDPVYADKATVDADVNFTAVKGAEVTLFAQWTEDDYVIEFIKEQGTTESPFLQDVTFDVPTSLENCTFSKPGYDFLGWKFVVDTNDDVIADGAAIDHAQFIARVSDLDHHVKLVGQWKAHTYEFKFNVNKPANTTETPTPQSMANQVFTYDVEAELNENEFVIKGYTFDRWTLDAAGTQELTGFQKNQPTKILNYTSEKKVINLYAQWTANEYQIQLYRNVRQNDDDEFYTLNTNAKFDQSYLLPSNPFVRTGYLPDGWKNHTTGESYANNALVKNLSYSIAEVARLDAQWKPINYTIVFHNNDSVGDTKVVGSVASYLATYDQEIDWPQADFTREGYTFEGWSLDASTKVVKYPYNAAGYYSAITEVKNLADTDGAVINLYAVWTPHTYKIAFDMNGGTPQITTIDAVYDQTYETPYRQDFVNVHKDGYKFLGWSKVDGVIAPDYATTSVLKNLTPDEGSTVTLHAVWNEYGYVIHYNANGGTGTTADTIATAQSVYATLRASGFTRSGYTFKGWNTKADGTGTTYAAGTTGIFYTGAYSDINNEVTLYAMWSLNSTYTPSTNKSSGSSGGGGGGGGAITFTAKTTDLNGSWENLGNNQWVFNNADGSGRFTGWGYKSYTNESGTTLTYKYHFGTDGIMTYGWYFDEAENAWYYLSETNDGFFGHMVTGWHKDPQDGRWYYLDPTTGKMVTGEQVIDGKTYYFNEVAPAQSWYRDAEGNWVYFDYQVRTYGSMYCNEVTPAGWTAGADGAKI